MGKLPTDLHKALASNSKVKAKWEDLTPIARRDFMSWIESAKQPETRKRRVDSIGDRLLSGKRRPCCYAIVPMNLYKALDTNPKAKTHWKALTPDDRRDFTDWIEAAKQPAERQKRIEKAGVLLAAGKKSP